MASTSLLGTCSTFRGKQVCGLCKADIDDVIKVCGLCKADIDGAIDDAIKSVLFLLLRALLPTLYCAVLCCAVLCCVLSHHLIRAPLSTRCDCLLAGAHEGEATAAIRETPLPAEK
jgi:hypothetical protein